MSVRLSTFLASRHCSGDMYMGVPSVVPVWVAPLVKVWSATSLAMPKSRIFTRTPAGMSGSGTTKMLAGFRSR